jgi:xylulokinase
VGAKTWASVDEVCQQSVRIAKQIDPDPATSALMNQQYELYRRIYPALREIRRNSHS